MPYSNRPVGARVGDPLTDREREILSLLSEGNSPPEIAARLGIALRRVKHHTSRIYIKIGARPDTNRLTRRELEVLRLLTAGNSTADIAEQLGITQGTVKTHLTTVYRKIGAKNRVQAARYFLDHLARSSEA